MFTRPCSWMLQGNSYNQEFPSIKLIYCFLSYSNYINVIADDGNGRDSRWDHKLRSVTAEPSRSELLLLFNIYYRYCRVSKYDNSCLNLPVSFNEALDCELIALWLQLGCRKYCNPSGEEDRLYIKVWIYYHMQIHVYMWDVVLGERQLNMDHCLFYCSLN